MRLDLEDMIGALVIADERLRVAIMRMSQWARTDYEAETIVEIIQARQAIGRARERALEYHPNREEREK